MIQTENEKLFMVEEKGSIVPHVNVVENDDFFVLVPCFPNQDGRSYRMHFERAKIYDKKEPDYPLEYVENYK